MNKGLVQTLYHKAIRMTDEGMKKILIISHEGNTSGNLDEIHCTPIRIAVIKTVDRSKC